MNKRASRKGAQAQKGMRGRNAGDGVAFSFVPLRLCARLPLLLRFAALACLIVCAALVVIRPHAQAAKGEATHAQAAQSLIESALFTRVEFFGTQALVPYPTAEARNRLAAMQAEHADEPEIYLKLAQLDEQLGRADEAARELERYVALKHDDALALEQLASFYDRRADFAQEAATLERLLAHAPASERAGFMQRLIELARVHQLPKYLTPAFYEQVIAQDPTAYAIIEQYIDKLSEQKSYAAALKVLRAHKAQFPERAPQLVEKEATLLDSLGHAREAEQVYEAAFDPFWPDELSDSFYEFLKSHDRYRAYGRELRTRFQRDPSDYDVAVRLVHFTKHDYDADPSVFVQLERARAARGNKWQPEELATIARLLLADGYEDAASRFLYTLYLQGGLKPGGELRAKVLYQLFALLTDANDQRLALTNGDLKFYQDIATSDPHPGITGGILSLLLSDTSPRFELDREEQDAVKYFNRAAAYRIFNAYKQEYPTAPELAQMYLDIVRLYTATNEPEIAAATLAEFEGRYADAPQFPEVALKLADCYITLEQYDKERALYPRLLDYLATHRRAGIRLVPDARQAQAAAAETNQTRTISISSEPTDTKPVPISYPPDSNQGVEIPGASQTTNENYYDRPQYQDHLDVPTARWHTRTDERISTVTYAQVLERYVASLARGGSTEEILALYSAEIKKHPEEAGLYEQMLQWLGQTKLVDEQLRVYQAALKQFPGTVWQDRMARWFLRQQRKQEFEKFSRDLLAQLDDAEVEAYLAEFITQNANADAKSFEAQLYLGLYSLAHERFPHDMSFVQGLLHFYSTHERWAEWRALMAEYYFTSREIRDQFLVYLSEHRELRARLDEARERCRAQAENDPGALASLPYKLFRADAAAWLSNYEEAIDAYRELNRLYPNTPEYSERLVAFTRSLGQHNRKFLEEAASVSHALADNVPSSSAYRTRAGELQAELGDYARARGEWEQLIALGRGAPETYLDTATVYWDYYQYADALRIINQLRAQAHDETLYAFQAAAILEAQHKQPAALIEYAKALDNNGDDYGRAQRRLVTLYKRPGVPAQLREAVAQARASARAGSAHDDSALVLGYVSLLQAVGQQQEASVLLRQEIATNHDQDFLDSARAVFSDAEDTDGERAALRQLTQAARGPHSRISYRLQLAASYAGTGEMDGAASVLDELLAQYPTNYGVLNEAASFYWRLGRRAAALNVLRAGATHGRGRFHYLFARKLAARELELNHSREAERVLLALHNEDKSNTDVFHELMRLYVRDGRRAQLQQIFRETLAALKAQDIGHRDLQEQVAEFRTQLIDAFTRLHDYRAAVEQHIEIINRDPDDEEKLSAAITYVKRYGGADTLLDYYQKTAQAAYKNYRWNVVLARIYEAKGDYGAAAANYRAALENQPEMLELYSALAGVCQRGKDYDGALTALNKAAELSNDDPQYVRPIVTLLEQLGRSREAAAARAKLPPEPTSTPQSAADQFAAAARLHGSETAKAVATYRQAFDAFVATPYSSDLHGADITGYVQTVRAEEPLPQIAARLWQLRERLITDADSSNEKLATKARERLQTLDSALPEALGRLAAERATGDELQALFSDWQTRIDDALKRPNDPHDTLALLQNLSRRAGFGALEEKILLAQKDAAFASGNAEQYHGRLHALIDYYVAAGAYHHTLDLLLTEQGRDTARDKFDYLPLIADYARLVGDRERELLALRTHYERTSTLSTTQFSTAQFSSDDTLVARYFDALLEAGASGRAELQQLAGHASAHQLQLINFLLAHDEGALAHTAIAHAPLSVAWQLARNAEASLALKETSADNENYFVTALQFKPIGALVTAHADTSRQLVGDDWAQLAARYGQWLYQANKPEQRLQSRAFLPALIENRPHDANEQAKLGRWYLDAHEPQRALEHLQLALEAQPDDEQLRADLGAAYFVRGDKERARKEWRKIIARDNPVPASCALFLRTLAAHGLTDEARAQLLPILSAQLKKVSEGWRGYDTRDEHNKDFADYKPLLHALADSFAPQTQAQQTTLAPDVRVSLPAPVEAARATFFRQLCTAAPEGIALPDFVVSEPLVAHRELAPFYEMLVERSAGLDAYERDYDFNAQLSQHWDAREAEEALDHENGFKPSEPKSDRLEWQRRYLAYLFAAHDQTKASALVADIETELKGRYARPLWLRLAGARLELRAGHTAQAYDLLKHLIGVEASAHIAAVKPPDSTRLNESCALLRAEGHAREADALLAAAYTRQLALAQYDATYFDALARLAYKAHDIAQGRALLQMMLDLAQEETRPTAEAALAAATWLRPFVVEDTSVELPEAANRINYNQSLALAADTAAEFAQFDFAISCRQKLRTLAPDDEVNRIELARLFAANGQREAARENLAAIISDRTTTRHARWQALWLAPELCGDEAAALQALRARVAAESRDEEMLTALDALAQSVAGRNAEARALAAKLDAAAPNPYVRSFRALLDIRDGQTETALASLNGALTVDQSGAAWSAFGLPEAEALRDLMRVYLALGQTRAALRLAERDTGLKLTSAPQPTPKETDAASDDESHAAQDHDAVTRDGSEANGAVTDPASAANERPPAAFQSLSIRLNEQATAARVALLSALSAAAEEIGEFKRALEFERARFAALDKAADRRACAARIARLQAAQQPASVKLIVDARTVAQH